MLRSYHFKSGITYVAVGLLAGLISFALWYTGFLHLIEAAFVLAPENEDVTLSMPTVRNAMILIGGASLVSALVVGRFGVRRAFPFLGSGLIGFTGLSLLASWYFSFDVLFTPITLAASISAILMQFKRLRDEDVRLSRKLTASSGKLESLQADAAELALSSGLKLLDTVLSPSEAVVFSRDSEDRLVSSARLRVTANLPETGRNSSWREGVNLCERAIATSDFVVEKSNKETLSTNVAMPLQHEDRTVGALLIRLDKNFDQDDRKLLAAVGRQMARNLQRQEAHRAATERNAFSFFSDKAARQKLQSLYALNGALIEQSIGINALAEVDNGVALAYLDGRIASVNKALLALADLSQGQQTDLNFFALLDRFRTDVFDEPVMAVRRVLETGEAYERELHFENQNKTYGLRISLVRDELSRTSQGLDNSDRPPLCLALVVKDLTQIKQYEQLKSDMISLMSHELRTPLTSINGFAELLTTDESLSGQTKEFVTIIANESQRLSRMINTFLAVTQLERKDKQEVLKIPLRLDEVVKETIASLQPVAKKRRIRLVEQPANRLPPVAADKSMITQAVKNLLSNAIKYSPERTTVTVSTALEAEAVRLCVEDRGYGIPAEARDRVWEKFYRVVREGQEKDEESTGLGLSFVREVVEQHGGTVDLDSEVGRGSKFSFTLPRL